MGEQGAAERDLVELIVYSLKFKSVRPKAIDPQA